MKTLISQISGIKMRPVLLALCVLPAMFVLSSHAAFAQSNSSVPASLQGLGGNCLDVRNGNSSPGAQVDNATCNGTRAQNFVFFTNGTIRNSWGWCLDVLNGNAEAGVLDFTGCNGTAAQQWQQKGSQFVGLAGKCLDVLYGSSSSGTTVDLASCNGTAAQDWQLINAPTVLNAVGTKCLDIIDSNTSPGARLQIFECNRGPNAQIFTFTAAGEIRNAVGECLDVYDGNPVTGMVQMWSCNGSTGQKWQRGPGRQIASALVNASSLAGYCLGTVNTSGADPKPLESAQNHTNVGLVPCDGTEAQQWIPSNLFIGGPATLLIVTSDAFVPGFTTFVAHKQSIGMNTVLLGMSQIRTQYPASDDPLSIKRAIEDYYRNIGTQYVLLGGDGTQVPIRFRGMRDSVSDPLSEGGTTHSFPVADLYYANLYSGHTPHSGEHEGFDNWDANGDGLYNEQAFDTPLLNPDNVDGFPDVSVGRIPAADAGTLQAALGKIINYENENPVYNGSGFPPQNQIGYVADACYGTAYNFIHSIAESSLLPGYYFSGFAEEVGDTDGKSACNAPTQGANGEYYTIDDANWDQFLGEVQQSQYEWIAYVGHAGTWAWGGLGTLSYSTIAELTNKYSPIVLAVACQSSQFAAVYRHEPPSWIPWPYDPSASDSLTNIGSTWLTAPNGGAVAYMGENVVMQDDAGSAFLEYVFQRHANGYVRLGDMWRMAQQDYFNANFQNPGYDSHFSAPRIYLSIMSLLGDPSMRTQ